MIWNVHTTRIVWPDSRDIVSYGAQVKLAKECYDFKLPGLNGKLIDFIVSLVKRDDFLFRLGVAIHPLQDKWGHSDYYMEQKNLLNFVSYGTREDDVEDVYTDATGIKHEHFEEVIKSRDETYSVLGRFFKDYSEVMKWSE